MAHFSEEELCFVKELPEHVEIECPVCRSILTDPHLVSCCGHNFCGSCIERVQASNGFCPMCKEKEYQVMANKERFRIINGLEVYCSNKEKGCQWKGELKNLPAHLNKEKRDGECQYEEVKCRYEKCQERKQRRHLKDHEDSECPQRPFQCKYCGEEVPFLSIKNHYKECRQYPVICPNKCSSTTMPRGSINTHMNWCPLQPVDCVFSWAGCNDKPLLKDVDEHTADTKHMTLLAVACGQLKKENEQIKVLEEELGKLKIEKEQIRDEMMEEVDELTKEIKVVKSCVFHEYPLLPVDVVQGEAVHFYTTACGCHMSARLMTGNRKGHYGDFFILLALHKGSFNKFKPKLPAIFAKFGGAAIPLIDAGYYRPSPADILNSIQWRNDADTTVPQGVVKIRLGRYTCIRAQFDRRAVPIYTQKVHHNQISTSKLLLPVIDSLRVLITTSIETLRDVYGYNLYSMRQLHRDIAVTSSTGNTFTDVSIDSKNKKKKRSRLQQ